MTLPLVVHSVDQLHGAVGRELGPSPWLRVGTQQVVAFTRASGDRDRAPGPVTGGVPTESGPRTVPDLLTLALISTLATSLYDLRLGSARLNYGLDRVRFPAPVRVGSRVRLRCTLREPEGRRDGVLLPIDFTVELEGSRPPACVARKMSLVVLR